MQVGDYVRTKQGYIRQIKEIYDHILYYVNLDKSITMERYGKFEPITQLDRDTIDEIIKSSSNILELLRVDDYINGKKIIKIWEEPFGEFAGQIFTILDGEETAPTIREIKSIVTKEQFESIEYKVGVDKE